METKTTAPERLWWDGTAPHDYYPDKGLVAAAKTLTELADVYGSDKGNIGCAHNYTSVYERLISPAATVSLCEIGVACGASLKMWSEYLPNARIVGIDIRDACATLCKENKNVEIVVADAKCLDFTSQFDVVIDDASHLSQDIVEFFEHCWGWVKPGGLYIIEDLACTYSDPYAEETNKRFNQKKRNNRIDIMDMMDKIMRRADSKADIISFEYYSELLILRKSAYNEAEKKDSLFKTLASWLKL